MHKPVPPVAHASDRWIVIGAVALTVVILAGLASYLFYIQSQFQQILMRDLRIEHESGEIRELDELLTMSARLCAATGDLVWEERYLRHVDALDEAIKAAAMLVSESVSKEFTSQTDVANQKLVAMELRAFDLVRSQRKQEAFALLTSAEYAGQKNLYSAGVATLIEAMHQQIAQARRQHESRTNVAGAAIALGTLVLVAIWIYVGRSLIRYRSGQARAEGEQKRLAAILEVAPDFVGFANPKMEIQFINRAGRAMVGIGATEDIAGLTIADVHPAWFMDEMRAQMRAGLANDVWRTEGAFKNRAGQEIPISMVLLAHRGTHGTVEFYSTISRDITERRRADEEQQKLASLVENSDDFIGVATLDEKAVYVNPAGRRLVGLETSAELENMSIWEVVHPSSHAQSRQVILPLIRKTGVWHGETQFQHQQTRAVIPVELSAFVVMHPRTRQPLCLATVAHDVRERQQAKSEIVSLNARLKQHVADLESALAESEEFAYAAAHNLRSPLRGIDGFCQVVLEEDGAQLSPDGRQHLARVRQAAQTMAGLIEALLKIARLNRAQVNRQRTDLSSLANEIAGGLQRREPERDVEFVVADNLSAECDGTLVRVVLEELLENAWKFTAPRPRARIEFTAVCQRDGASAFVVRDDGVGFDMAYADKLFVPFQHLHSTSEFAGTGIGLATVQRIIRRHGGRVWAEGVVGQGAAFYFTL